MKNESLFRDSNEPFNPEADEFLHYWYFSRIKNILSVFGIEAATLSINADGFAYREYYVPRLMVCRQPPKDFVNRFERGEDCSLVIGDSEVMLAEGDGSEVGAGSAELARFLGFDIRRASPRRNPEK